MADQLTSDELLLEIDQALEAGTVARTPDPVTDWADGPGAAPELSETRRPLELGQSDDPFPLPAFGADDDEEDEDEDDSDSSSLYEAIEAVDDEPEGSTRFASLLGLGGSKIGRAPLDLGNADEFGDEDEDDYADQDAALAAWQLPRGPLSEIDEASAMAPAPVETHDYAPEPANDVLPTFESAFEPVADYPVPALVEANDWGLHDCLAAARELALAARSCEDRSRSALYAAVGRAYDFSLAAQAEPDAFAELIADSGLSVQERAPMTPVVKLVFGADYDKTRLTEYAAVLSHAHRMGVERGTLANLLSEAEGGLKGVVQAERDYRRADGSEVAARETPREALARKLRAIAPLGFEDIEAEGDEFAVVMIRRVEGKVVVLGEVTETALVEKVAKKLVA